MSDSSPFHYAPPTTLVRVAQLVGITTSAALTGFLGCYSHSVTPIISLAPAKLTVEQWQLGFWLGAKTAPPIALVAALSWGYLASQAAKAPRFLLGTALDPRTPFTLYSLAAVLVPSIVPFTLIAMRDTNAKLHAKADELSTRSPDTDDAGIVIKDEEDVSQLVRKWSVLNAGRALLTGLGAVLGTWAVVSRPEVVGLEVVNVVL